jgi:hypothetical protein
MLIPSERVSKVLLLVGEGSSWTFYMYECVKGNHHSVEVTMEDGIYNLCRSVIARLA